MSTLAVLFEALAAARRLGVDFEDAWQAANVEALARSCDAADWSPVLESTRGSWEAAYHRWPASAHERALSLLGEGMELVELGRGKGRMSTRVDTGRVCRRCNEPIPPERCRRSPASFCSDRCRRAWHSARARATA